MSQDNLLAPLVLFRFHVDFKIAPLSGDEGDLVSLCGGSFSECSGIEATMEPKVIDEGGLNFGAHQRVGKTTFGTVILKRGITTTQHAWKWFELVNQKYGYAYRMHAIINVYKPPNLNRDDRLDRQAIRQAQLPLGAPAWVWRLEQSVPTKFRFGDLNAKATDVGVEELHLAYQGLSLLDNAEATREAL